MQGRFLIDYFISILGVAYAKMIFRTLPPLGYDHINIIGHYSFDLPKEILAGKLRPLQPMDKKLFGKER